jgi:hypothetical protein
MDVSVNVGLGYGMTEDRIAALQLTCAKQEAILQQLGPNNPLVDMGQYRNTLAKLLELGGYKDTAQFFKPIPVGFQMPQPQPQPSPEQLLADVEMQKIRADMATDAARLDLDRDKLVADILLKAREIEAQYDKAVDVASIKASIESDRLQRAEAN